MNIPIKPLLFTPLLILILAPTSCFLNWRWELGDLGWLYNCSLSLVIWNRAGIWCLWKMYVIILKGRFIGSDIEKVGSSILWLSISNVHDSSGWVMLKSDPELCLAHLLWGCQEAHGPLAAAFWGAVTEGGSEAESRRLRPPMMWHAEVSSTHLIWGSLYLLKNIIFNCWFHALLFS